MKKMVYEMNVEWNWIKQRPHFLAEELAKFFDITVLYQYRYNRKGLQNREVKGDRLKPVYVIPLIGRSFRLHQINVAWVASRFAAEIRKIRPEFVYITRPEMVASVKTYKGTVIYDCMDDYYAFSKEDWIRRKTFRDEKMLMNRADVVFATSTKLKESLIERYGKRNGKKIHIVRNGFGGEIMPAVPQVSPKKNGRYTFCYFGTIDTWFDFDLVMKSLEEFPDIEYLLIGPSKMEIPAHERIRYIGTVEHERLGEVTAEADCFIMPFVVNEIIEAVDPVKLYEYINFNKNILCVHYKEVERFSEFVHFYECGDYSSYENAIKTLKNNHEVSYSWQKRLDFLAKNGWNARAEKIARLTGTTNC